MAAYLRAQRRARPSSTSASPRSLPLDEVATAARLRASGRRRAFADCNLRALWLQIDPRPLGEGGRGRAGALHRPRAAAFVSFCISALGLRLPVFVASDSDLRAVLRGGACTSAGRCWCSFGPHRARAPGCRAAAACQLDLCHPRYVDPAGRFAWPDVQIVTGRPGPWPWQDEMISIMIPQSLTCGASWHGWSPKYLTDPFKPREYPLTAAGPGHVRRPTIRCSAYERPGRRLAGNSATSDTVLAKVFHGKRRAAVRRRGARPAA